MPNPTFGNQGADAIITAVLTRVIEGDRLSAVPCPARAVRGWLDDEEVAC